MTSDDYHTKNLANTYGGTWVAGQTGSGVWVNSEPAPGCVRDVVFRSYQCGCMDKCYCAPTLMRRRTLEGGGDEYKPVEYKQPEIR